MNLDDLNPEQRDAVTMIDGPLMILAGAGTGKTRVITYRIAYMLRSGIPPRSIVALSFTNKAAREMTERVRALVGNRAQDVWLGTFHSFCLGILRRFPKDADLSPGFGLADTSDQLDLVQRGLEEKNWAGLYQADRMHHQIGIAKNQMLSVADLRKGQGHPQITADLQVLAEVYALYERQLKLHRVIDFDDCIFKTVCLLRDVPHVREALRRDFRYLMVDEYQDTNRAQLSVLAALASDTNDVCAVGDDDQSIYSWRGAMFEVLEQFEQLFPGTRVTKLEQNYRCSNVILGAANQVIKNNTKRKEKTLWSASTETTPLTIAPCENEAAESRFVAEKCLTLFGGGMEPKDIGILYRANNQAKALELALREARVAYKTYGGQSFFERKEVKDFVCYLRLLLESGDRLAMWRVINTPNRGIGLKTLERIEDAARNSSRTPYDIIADESSDASVRTESVRKFVTLIEELKAQPLDSPEAFEALGHKILKLSGLEVDVRVKTADGGSRERKLANLRSLPAWLSTLAADVFKQSGTFDRRLLLDSLCLDADRKNDKDTGGNHVSLMTIHAAKGLEFPAVFVVGVEEEQLPHKNSIQDPNALCEERRLFYVALTRAKKKLFLSYCLERSGGYQASSERTPSRFLAEMPKESFLRTDSEESMAKRAENAAARKQQTVGRLSALRSSLRG